MKNLLSFKSIIFILSFFCCFTIVNAEDTASPFSSSPLYIIDTCFTGGNLETSFGTFNDIAGLDGDLMEWNGSGWTGSWPNALLSIPPLNNSTCRAIFIGASSGWTGGGEGFGLRLNTPIVAGQTYEFYFTYVSHGTASTGIFNPTLFTNSFGNNLFGAESVGQLPDAGTDWETNSITFTATTQQDGDDWIILHTLSNCGSGMVAAYCCGEVDNACVNFTSNVNTTNADCISGGTATAFVSGNCSSPTYNWSTGESGSTISNLTAGSYSVTILDDCCENMQSFFIDLVGDVPLADLGDDLSICDGNTIMLNAENIGATYLWSTGAISQEIQVTSPGIYSVTITNAFGCTNVDEIEIELTNLTLSLNPSNPDCDPASGLIDLEVANGQAPYTYLWSTGDQSQDISNLTPGWYFVTTTDSNDCVTTDSVFISAPVLPQAIITPSNVFCPDAADGNISIEVLSGTAPFSYNWSNGETTEEISNLDAGDYELTITDANNCTNTFSATLSEPPSFEYAFSTSDACGNFAQAFIQVNNGGNAPYSYIWSNGETSDLIQNLSGGSYTVTVTDANNCSFVSSTSVTTFDEVIIDIEETHISCFGLTDGAIDLSVIQGENPFSFEWDSGQTSEDIENLDNGIYSILVSDANGCLSGVAIEINEPNPIGLIVSTTLPTVGNDGELSIQPTGGTPPFLVTWSNGDVGLTADSLAIGMYNVFLTDANGCTYMQTINLTLTSVFEDANLTQYDVYPNPNGGQFNIDLAFAKSEKASLRIFDVLGREVFVEHIDGSEAQVRVDLKKFSSGIYFAVLEVGGEWATRRVVVE